MSRKVGEARIQERRSDTQAGEDALTRVCPDCGARLLVSEFPVPRCAFLDRHKSAGPSKPIKLANDDDDPPDDEDDERHEPIFSTDEPPHPYDDFESEDDRGSGESDDAAPKSV